MGEYKTFKELYGNGNGSETLKKLAPYKNMSSEKALANILKILDVSSSENNESSNGAIVTSKPDRRIDHSRIDEAVKAYNQLEKCSRAYRRQLQADREFDEEFPGTPHPYILSDLSYREMIEARDCYLAACDKVNKDDLRYLISELKEEKRIVQQERVKEENKANQKVKEHENETEREKRYKSKRNKFSKLKNFFFFLFVLFVLTIPLNLMFNVVLVLGYWFYIIMGALSIVCLILNIVFRKEFKKYERRYKHRFDERLKLYNEAEEVMERIANNYYERISNIETKIAKYEIILNKSYHT